MSIGDRRGLSDELVEPLFDDSAVALAVDIYAMCGCRRLSTLILLGLEERQHLIWLHHL